MAKKKPIKKRTGRKPIKYSEAIADKICELISVSAVGLKHLLAGTSLPKVTTVYKWLDENQSFAKKYARARELQADFLAGQTVEIADKPLIGKKIKETKDGVFEEVGDNVERSRLMVDARKWMASKLAPKKYGDKLDLTTKDGPVQFGVIVTDQSVADELQKLRESAQKKEQ